MNDVPASDGEADYLARVERHFGLRRGGRVVLSPRDWQLVQEWQARGVPLEVVLRGINRAFDLFAIGGSRRQSINSLAYCRQHVEEALSGWTDRATATGAGPTGAPLASAAQHLRQAAIACEQAAAGALDAPLRAAAAGLRRLAERAEADDASVAELDAAAEALEQDLAAGAAECGEGLPKLPRFSPWQV